MDNNFEQYDNQIPKSPAQVKYETELVALEPKYNKQRKLRNYSIIAMVFFIVAAVLLHNFFDGEKAYKKYENRMKSGEYVSAEIVGLGAFYEYYSYDKKTGEKKGSDSFYCLFSDTDGNLGVVKLSASDYSSYKFDKAKAYFDSGLSGTAPEAVRVYGDTKEVENDAAVFLMNENTDLMLESGISLDYGSISIDGSLEPQKEASLPYIISCVLAVVSGLFWFVMLLMVNLKFNKIKKLKADIDYEKTVTKNYVTNGIDSDSFSNMFGGNQK